MPRRLLLAAEILRDVARTVDAADRPLLEAAADELVDKAAALCAAESRYAFPAPEMATIPASIRRLAAAFEAEVAAAERSPVH